MPQQAPSPDRTDIDVLKPRKSMWDLFFNPELCRLGPELCGDCGIAVGDQIRLERNAGHYALYTVSALLPKGFADVDVRMGLMGRQKLGTSQTLSSVALYTGGNILRSYLNDWQAWLQSEFVERLTDNGVHTGLVTLAPHGGGIEPWTDRQAEYVATRLAPKGVSSWRCKGWNEDGNAHNRWHIAATDISRRSFPLLDSIADREFTYSVAFHGWSYAGVMIGGAGPLQLKQELQNAIIASIRDLSIDVTIADENDMYNGDDSANLVNWLTTDGAGGIQLEQSVVARSKYWEQIANAVASVFDPLI